MLKNASRVKQSYTNVLDVFTLLLLPAAWQTSDLWWYTFSFAVCEVDKSRPLDYKQQPQLLSHTS